MGGHPIEDHAKAGLMRAIDEALEAGRIAKPPRGCEKAYGLIAPRGIERMLRDGQQLEMGESHIHSIRDELIGKLVVREKAVPAIAPP